MDKNIDYGTLSWVKQEIDETLAQARQALEEFVDNPEDATQLQFCFSYLHQVTGTLQMVELYGAALLAEEMERLAQALINGEVAQRTEAYEVLMRGILQLPDYLERVQSGFADEPLVLLPLLNDLRAARGENLLSENALFAPDLSGEMAVPEGLSRDDADEQAVAQLARNLRHRFQVGLLGWIRNQDVGANLAKMSEVVNELEHHGTRQSAVRLWWVAGAVLEALAQDGVDSSVSIKKLLGQVDREIKRLIDAGEQSLADAPANELLKNLLYYVARSVKSTPRVAAVKERFKLGGAVPNAEEIATAREQLAGPNAAMMRTVADAIREDLAGVKDALDLFLRSDARNPQELAPLTEVLRKVGDTLGMLGMGMPRKVIQDQEAAITRILDGQLDASEERLMEIAGSLLYAESCLQGLVESRITARHQSSREPDSNPTPQLPAAELREIGQTVLREVSAGINLAKDAIVAFIDSPWDHELLVDVPQQFAQVRGAVQMLGMDTVSRLLDAASRYIESRLLGERIKPEQYELDALADAISSVEYFLEARLDDRAPAPSLLDVARRSVATLGFAIEESDADDQQDLLEPVETEAPGDDITMVMKAPGTVIDAQSGVDAAVSDEAEEAVEEITLAAPAATEDEAVSIEESSADESVPEASAAEQRDLAAAGESGDEAAPNDVAASEPQSQAASAPPRGSAIADDLDDDILEIFVEEAREELGAINEMLPKWRKQHGDHEALGRMRRSFHTLKGSGRLVGATAIGELSWSIENLLNRLLDQTIPVHDGALAVIGDAAAALPQLIDALEQHEQAPLDVQPLIDRAFAAVENGKSLPAASEQPAQQLVEEAMEVTSAPDESAEEDVAETMDSQLHEIFSKESAGHLEAIHAFMACCRDDAQQCAVDEALIRALHTLHGSARMAGADAIAELAGWLEKYAKALLGNDELMPEEGMQALGDAVATVEHMLAHINDADIDVPGREALVARLRTLYETEQARVEERLRREQNAQRAAASASSAQAEQAEYDQELVEVFLEEAAEILDSSDGSMQRWRDEPDNLEIVASLQRDLHTLKGGARMAGIAAIGDLSHGLESLLEAVVDQRARASAAVQDAVHRALDRLYGMLERTQALRPVEAADDLVVEVQALLANGGEPVVGDSSEPSTPDALDQANQNEVHATAPMESAEVVPFPQPPADTEEPEADTGDQNRRGQGQEMVRVRADLLDNLVNYAGEVSIYRARLEQNVGAFGFNLVELGQTVTRLRDQLRNLEIETEAQILYRYEIESDGEEDFDPLEMDRYSQMQQLSRALMESVADISSIEGLLDGLVSESETLLLQQSRVNTDLQEGLMRTRMVPFTGLVPRLRRIVRQTAQELGKHAQLHVSGAQGEMDRTVLDRILAPLEHMLRNAVSHGIEAPELRRERGKPEAGSIHVSMAREGSEVVITVTDDGAGMDLDAIRRKASERGLIADSAELTDHDVMQFVLESGFSTAAEVTQISGRGVGMDVVNSEIKQLGGVLQIDSRHGQGTRFVVRLPFTLAVNQALLVAVGDEHYAVPLTSVEGIVRMSRPQLEGFFDAPTTRYEYGGRDYQVQSLGALLGAHTQLSEGTKLFPVMLVRSGDHRMALQIDALMGSREIVVKSVGPQISTIRSVSGATILGDGRVVLILDVAALIRVSAAARTSEAVNAATGTVPSEAAAPTVMVVDDSITVRKVTSRLLQRNGMQVLTAKDGVDAVAQLQEHIPDVMLLDIEMPRMDGFELATHIRNEARLKNIPIIMITSRTGDKHRRRAREIGVDRYLGKPYQESDLLQNIQELLQERSGDS